MQRHLSLLSISVVLATSLVGCIAHSDAPESLGGGGQAVVQIAGPACTTLLAGQTIDVGTVCSAIVGEELTVTYQTTGGWTLDVVHLWTGTDLATLPQTSAGNPKVGNFPYNSGPLVGATTYTVHVPFSTFGLSSSMTSCAPTTAYVVAHAGVERTLPGGGTQQETAYGDGPRLVDKGNWATSFSLSLTCVAPPPPPDAGTATCQTAFGRATDASTCFIGSPWIDTPRWGWTNGPIGPGSYSFELWAGAAQCDLAKGTRVGSVSVVYDGATATVRYETLPGFTLDETHLYVGTAPLASFHGGYTVAPGQFGNQHALSAATTDSFTIGGLSGSIYVVAHAGACSTSW